LNGKREKDFLQDSEKEDRKEIEDRKRSSSSHGIKRQPPSFRDKK